VHGETAAAVHTPAGIGSKDSVGHFGHQPLRHRCRDGGARQDVAQAQVARAGHEDEGPRLGDVRKLAQHVRQRRKELCGGASRPENIELVSTAVH